MPVLPETTCSYQEVAAMSKMMSFLFVIAFTVSLPLSALADKVSFSGKVKTSPSIKDVTDSIPINNWTMAINADRAEKTDVVTQSVACLTLHSGCYTPNEMCRVTVNLSAICKKRVTLETVEH